MFLICRRAEGGLSCGLRKSFWNALFAVAKINKTSVAPLSGFGDISADAKRPGELVAPAKVLSRRTRPAEVRRSDMLRHALHVPLVEVLGRLVRGAAASGAAAGVISILGEKAFQPLGFEKRSGCGVPPERPRLGPDGPVDPHKKSNDGPWLRSTTTHDPVEARSGISFQRRSATPSSAAIPARNRIPHAQKRRPSALDATSGSGQLARDE